LLEGNEDTIAHSRVQQLLEQQGGKRIDLGNGRIVYLMPNNSVVRLPDGHARMKFSTVNEIAVLKLNMSQWEFDIWFGEQDRTVSASTPSLPHEAQAMRVAILNPFVANGKGNAEA
jgi:hypothetical protein